MHAAFVSIHRERFLFLYPSDFSLHFAKPNAVITLPLPSLRTEVYNAERFLLICPLILRHAGNVYVCRQAGRQAGRQAADGSNSCQVNVNAMKAFDLVEVPESMRHPLI
jgi:hypothetical protein